MIRAVMFDFGGVISSSPFEAFAHLEAALGLPTDFIRTVNATNPDANAWAKLERGEVDVETFGSLWSDEARALGHELDGRLVLERLAGESGRRWWRPSEPVERPTRRPASPTTSPGRRPTLSVEVARVYTLFDVVLESRVLGVRKPDPRFYELACEALGVTPDECVFLDDLGVNLKPARALGMHTIKVTDPDAALTELGEILGLSLWR